jgi:hypothetical protein
MAVVDLAKQVGTTKGDLYVYNGTTLVRLAVGANDTVLTADSAVATGVKWAAGGGGGGGGTIPGSIEYLITRLGSESAHADDDFFISDTTANYTTQTVSGTATWTLDANHNLLSAKFNNQSSGDAAAYLKALTSVSAPITIETAVRLLPDGLMATNGTEFAMAGIIFTDGTATTSNSVSVEFTVGSGPQVAIREGTLTNMAGGSAQTVKGNLFRLQKVFDRIYLRLVWVNATTVTANVSIDGVTWTDFGSADHTITSFTPTHAGFWVSTYAGNDEAYASFDYFRRNNANQGV